MPTATKKREYMTEDLVIGKSYAFKNRMKNNEIVYVGKLLSRTYEGAGGAGYQDPYFELIFEKEDGTRNSKLYDWDDKFILQKQ